MPRRITDQVVVVTGASSGIGRATVREFARHGAMVVAAARDEETLNNLVDEIGHAGRSRVTAVRTDVRDYTQVRSLAESAVARHGRIDTWVNGAAVHEYAWFEDTAPEEFRTVLDTNVMGQVHGVYAALPHLVANETGGAVIGISSVEGVRAVPLQSSYVTSKFALRGFYDAVRMEMRRRHPKVKVTTILPASIDTPIFEHARTRLPHLPMPPKPLYAPEVVARSIVHAAQRPQREIPVGGSAAQFILGQRFAPAVMDFLLTRDPALFGQQQTELPVPGRDNLDGPAPGDAQTRGGRLESSQKISSVKERSYFTEMVWQRPLVKHALLAGALAVIGRRLVR